jgi:hypothetical protein
MEYEDYCPDFFQLSTSMTNRYICTGNFKDLYKFQFKFLEYYEKNRELAWISVSATKNRISLLVMQPV